MRTLVEGGATTGESLDVGSPGHSLSTETPVDDCDVFHMNTTFEEMISDAIGLEENADVDEFENGTEFNEVHPSSSGSTNVEPPDEVNEESSSNYDHLVGNDGDSPIFPGLSCTKGQLVTLVLAFFLRFPNTKESLQGLLDLLNVLVPNCIRGTKYFFDRYFFGGLSSFDYHFICPVCFTYLGRNPKKDEKLLCSICKKQFELKELKKKGAFMLTKSIKSQLKGMLENGNLWESIQNRPRLEKGCYGEVYTGDLYRSAVIKTFLESGDNFTMTLNTDGVQVFNSSKYQIWPIMCAINEISSKLKSRFIVLHTLWFGLGKLRCDTFLRAFVEEARDLYINGFKWVDSNGTSRLSRVIFTTAVADAPARALLLERMQFNADYGCDFCLHMGENVEKGLGHVQVFPLRLPLPLLRTHESILEHANLAAQYGFPVMGIKGPSLLGGLQGFDLAKGLIPDSMHCLWLGIVVQFRKLWETCTDKPYYIQNMAVKIDNILCHIKPPEEILRIPRSMEMFGSDWKASENRNFCLFYSPVILKDLLPKKYYNHWLLFVNGCKLLFKKPVTDDNIRAAQNLFDNFIYDIPELYGVEHVSYNIHILQHIPQTVKNWGAPWSSSAFLFEDAGGELIQLFHGTRYVPEQIFSNFLAKRRLKRYEKRFLPSASDRITKVYESFNRTVDLNNDRIDLRGRCLLDALDISYLNAINERLQGNGGNCHCHDIIPYDRLVFKGKTYSTKSYCSNYQRDNSIVKLNDGESYVIDKIVEIRHDESCCLDDDSQERILLIGKELRLIPSRPLKHSKSNIDTVQFIKKVNENQQENIYRAFSVSEIFQKGMLIKDNDLFCIFYDTYMEK